MKSRLLDISGSSGSSVDRETLAEYDRLLQNPDLLGRLFRLFIFKHTRSDVWRDRFSDYVEKHSDNGDSWVNDKRTNLERVLFAGDTVTWGKFLEGLVIISPVFDSVELSVLTTLNHGKETILKIRPSSLIWDGNQLPAIPKGTDLIPSDFHRSPMEPLPLKVVRDAMTPIGTSANFRKIVRGNLKDIIHSSKLSSKVNSLYVSVLKSEMSWKRMTAVLFALGANQMVVSIRATKGGRIYRSVVKTNR